MNRPLCLAPLVLTCLAPGALAQGTWEAIDADFGNVRGCNYIAEYRSLAGMATPPAGYRGVASSVAMWRFSNLPGPSSEIDAHLNWLQGLGVNAVRVWLSHPLWYADRATPNNNRMLAAFAAFLAKCEARKIYVMPVLWDDHCYGGSPCLPPDYNDPAGEVAPHRNLSYWIPNPGQPTIAAWHANGYQDADFRDYVDQIAAIGRQSPALLMWDVMNEPELTPALGDERIGLITATIERLEAADPAHPTTIGFTGALPGSLAEPLVQHPDLDVISLHPYGSFRENVEQYARAAASIADRVSGAELDKPVIVTEIGQPGWGQAYDDVLDYVRTVRYGPPSEPTKHTGVGFFVFSAMCGWAGGNFPHREAHGIFFADGKVRDIGTCLALQGVALAQGVPQSTLTPRFIQKAWTENDHYFLGPLEDGHDFSITIRNIALPEWFYGYLPEATGKKFASLFEILSYDIAVLGVPSSSTVSMTMQEYQTMLLYAEVYRTGMLPGRSLTLAERNAVLNTWRFALLPFVARLTGPSR